MTSKKLGNLLRSVPPAVAASAPSRRPNRWQRRRPSRLRRAAPRERGRPIEPEVPLQVLVPKSIRKQLGLKAAEEGESLRALVLRAFRGIGLTVTDEQIAGKRGRRDA